MKTTHALRIVLVLLLSLALVAPFALRAQTPDGAKPPAVTNRERSAVTTKLREIRLDSVAYLGLPLGEVVKHLRDETIAHDTEKKGINFILNPNPLPVRPPWSGVDASTGLPVATEVVDIGSVMIKIDPPLKDMRLVDVLDAIVKVADHPLRYNVEDYAVMFSLGEPEARQGTDAVFSFPGGRPQDFVKAVQEQFKVDWQNVMDLPIEMEDVRIPRLRLNLSPGLDARPVAEGGPLGALVTLYNQVGEQKPELGHLVIRGNLAKPSVVLFVPSKSAGDSQPKFKVKAFSIYGLSDAAKAKLREDIERAREEAVQYTLRLRGGGQELAGMVAMHNDTSLLVATGQEAFVEMVESMVAASMANERAKNPGTSVVQPTTPPK